MVCSNAFENQTRSGGSQIPRFVANTTLVNLRRAVAFCILVRRLPLRRILGIKGSSANSGRGIQLDCLGSPIRPVVRYADQLNRWPVEPSTTPTLALAP